MCNCEKCMKVEIESGNDNLKMKYGRRSTVNCLPSTGFNYSQPFCFHSLIRHLQANAEPIHLGSDICWKQKDPFYRPVISGRNYYSHLPSLYQNPDCND